MDNIKTINELSVYEIGSVDCEVWITNAKSGFNLEIESEDGIFIEEQLNPHAARAIADFCRQYLRSYERVLKQVA